jgi:hypothetical protein
MPSMSFPDDGIRYDLRKDGIDAADLQEWYYCLSFAVEALIYVTVVYQFSPRNEIISLARHVENSSSRYHNDLAADVVPLIWWHRTQYPWQSDSCVTIIDIMIMRRTLFYICLRITIYWCLLVNGVRLRGNWPCSRNNARNSVLFLLHK